jgi:cyclopropane fatty-acyl-phospholipid synthase-like methyltransferase
VLRTLFGGYGFRLMYASGPLLMEDLDNSDLYRLESPAGSLLERGNSTMAITNINHNSPLQNFRTPWDEGPRKALMKLVETGRLQPGRALDLGSGAARNALFLAKHGFDVTGVDCSAELVELARKSALAARLAVKFVVDDLTNLQKISGPFDVLVDYSTLDDLHPEQRDRYVENVVPLTRPGSQFVLYCLEWTLSWWEKLTLQALSRFGFGQLTLEPGEVKRRFGEYFHIQKVAGETKEHDYPRGYAVYLMTRKSS